MTMPIEQATVLRIAEILTDAGYTALTRPPLPTDSEDAVVVAAFEPVEADGRPAVWFTFRHSTDGENVDSGVASVSYAALDILISSKDSMTLVTLAQTLRLGLFTSKANYWPTTGTRRRVRHCRAASGGLQDRTDGSPILYVERMAASICFDDTPEGVATDG